jgi:MoxR-like ATPase
MGTRSADRAGTVDKQQLKSASELIDKLRESVERVIVGKTKVVELAIIALLGRGHVLIEDVPGVGKTVLAKAIAKSVSGEFQRVQCTPDLLPSDITGTFVYNQASGEFTFRSGPVFANFVLADEINRATPRTQSSLLECMEESQVTVERQTMRLPNVFQVIATQNPIEFQGTYPLPEAQKDRFLMRLKLGYLPVGQEVAMSRGQMISHPIESLEPVLTLEEVESLQDMVRRVYVDEAVSDYIVRLVQESRNDPNILLGASPRGSLGLMRGAQAMALIRGREFVIPDFVRQLAVPILGHRMILKPQAQYAESALEDIIFDLLSRVNPEKK